MNPLTRWGLAAVTGTLALAASPSVSPSTASDLRRQFNIDAAVASFDFVDLGPPGVTAGDSFVQTDTLTVDGRPAGSDLLHCVAAGDEAAAGLCSAVLVLGDATLTAAGRIPNFEPADGQPFRFAITGGTDRYRRAQGEIVVTETATGYTATIDVQI
jgi:hypothetical protein